MATRHRHLGASEREAVLARELLHPHQQLDIDGWYNTRRIQKDLGWRSPDEYETAWHIHQAQHDQTTIVQPEPASTR